MKIARREQKLILALIILGVCFAAFLLPQSSFAVSTSGNISVDSVAKAKKGDEVRIEVSTKKMTISTFIASVEYDPAVLKYKGFEGPSGDQSVYLTDAADDMARFDVTVERSESEPVIGMYAIGTADKKYAAAKPLVTLVFKAKKDGDVYYRLSESTAGKDGYTSPDVEKRSDKSSTPSPSSEGAGDKATGDVNSTANDNVIASNEIAEDEISGVNADTTAEAQSAGTNRIPLIVGLMAAAALALGIAAMVVLKRKRESEDKEHGK